MEKLDTKMADAAERTTKDTYLESLLATLEACDLVLQNKTAFSEQQIARAEQLRAEAQKNIEKRLAIPMERRL